MKRIGKGIENFKEMINGQYYYIDKSNLINDTLNEKFIIYTRPRRFGKTLNMSMLYYFYSINEKDNAYLFDSLAISKNPDILYYQNQFPVIYLSFKDLKGNSLDNIKLAFKGLIKNFIEDHKELANSEYLDDEQINLLFKYKSKQCNDYELSHSLYFLSKCLYLHYHKQVLILIDEYDVPLNFAYQNGFYDEMTTFLSIFLSSALKTNDYLYKGILTGCLRISKESIFTGLNNFSINTITNNNASDCFGFTQKEVDEMLDYYSLNEKKDIVKEWYDGYLFGQNEIYNPWSINYYVDDLLKGETSLPTSYWANSSGNDIIEMYIRNANRRLRKEFETLIEGGSLVKDIEPQLTYKEMDDLNNIYSFLLFTGYLKIKNCVYDDDNIQVKDRYELIIPNKEVEEVYRKTFKKWFNKYTEQKRDYFIEALLDQDPKKAQDILQDLMSKSMSYYDSAESFYHGFLLGLLQNDDYDIDSNRESGNGRYDLVFKSDNLYQPAILIECKSSRNPEDLEKDALSAIKQIKDKNYIQGLSNEGYRIVYCYGISFYKKSCKVILLNS